MSGPDRRDSRHQGGFVGGSDPDFGGDEDYVVTLIGNRRAYSVRADVKVTFTPGCTSPANYQVSADVAVEFKARESDS